MQIEIEPSIREKIEALNSMAAQILQREGWPVNCRLKYHQALARKTGSQSLTLRNLTKKGAKRVLLVKHFNNKGEAVRETQVPFETWHNEIRTIHDRETQRLEAEQRRLLNRAEKATKKGLMPSTEFEKFKAQIKRRNPTAVHAEELAISEVNPAPGKTILELGPGKGEALEKLLSSGCQVTAVEYSDHYLAPLRKKFIGAVQSGSLKLIPAEYTAIPRKWWKTTQADHAISIFSTEIHPLPRHLFQRIFDSLKPGGKYTIIEGTPFHTELAKHLERAGFQIEKVKVMPEQITTAVSNITGEEVQEYYTMITARKPHA